MGWLAFSEFARSIAAAGILFLALCVLWFGKKIYFGNASEYRRNRIRAHSAMDVLLGRVNPRRDGIRDDKVAAGLAIKGKEWVEQGRFSDEALHDVLER